MTDLEKKIEELAEKYADRKSENAPTISFAYPVAKRLFTDFCAEPEFKELVEYIAREAVGNQKRSDEKDCNCKAWRNGNDCTCTEFNQDWFNKLWGKK
jgi:hypothetical protein